MYEDLISQEIDIEIITKNKRKRKYNSMYINNDESSKNEYVDGRENED